MKFRIQSANFDLMFGNCERFIEKYGEVLAPYKLKVKSDKKYGKAYITISSIQKIVELSKVLGEELIIGTDSDEQYIEIYDDYRG